jgi:hypothetical protein
MKLISDCQNNLLDIKLILDNLKNLNLNPASYAELLKLKNELEERIFNFKTYYEKLQKITQSFKNMFWSLDLFTAFNKLDKNSMEYVQNVGKQLKIIKEFLIENNPAYVTIEKLGF